MEDSKNKLQEMPLMGLGTWRLNGEECVSVIKQALDLGYRHIDTAMVYGNHAEVGKALKGFNREKAFITSKFLLEDVDFSQLDASIEALCDKILSEMQMDYLDLLLIHSPDHELPMEKVVFSMEKLRDKKKIRHLGVSNFTVRHLQNLLRHDAFVEYNQVEFHPYLFQKELWEYSLAKQVKLVAYRPLGKGALLNDPLFQFIGKKYHKTAAQVVLRWITQRNIPVISKAADEKHLKENINIFDFSLTEEEMHKIDALHRDIRFCMPDFVEFSY